MVAENHLPKAMQSDEISFLSDFRLNMYKFFSAVYNQPIDRKMIDVVLSSHFSELAEGFSSAETLSLLLHAVRDFDQDIDELRYEYNNLFIVPGGRYLTPYESVYRGRRTEKGKMVLGLLNGPETREVLRFYHAMGYEMDPKKIGPPDYVGTEIEFMSRLISLEKAGRNEADLETFRRYLEAEQRFFEDHLNQWVPALCRLLMERTIHPIYRSIASITVDFLEVEQSTFADLITADTVTT